MDCNEVNQSFLRCSALGDEFFDSFYANLVDQETAIGQMFAGTDMQKQNELVAEGIGHLIGFVEQNPASEPRLRELGTSHNRHLLNVRPEYYPLWVDSFLRAVKEHDPNHTIELEAQWREVLGPGIALMVSLY